MKIIIYSFYSVHSNTPAGNRLLAFTDFLSKQYTRHTVKTNNNYAPVVNSSLDRRSSIIKLVSSYLFRLFKSSLSFSPNLYIRSIDGSLFSSFFWLNILSILKNRVFGSQFPNCIIYSSYKPTANIVLGAFHSWLFDLPLIIEQRDLISQFGRKKKLPIIHFIDNCIDRLICARASCLIFVSPLQLQKASVFYKQPCYLFTNGIDNSPILRNVCLDSKDKIRILYAGTLSRYRSLSSFNHFLQDSIYSSRVELDVLSHQDPFAYGAPPQTNWLGVVSGPEYQKLLSTYDAFLVLEGDSTNSIENIPSKIFEYLGHNAPLMAFANPNSNLVELIDSVGYGLCIDSKIEFEKFFTKLWRLDPVNLSSYSRDAINQKLLHRIRVTYKAHAIKSN